MAIQSVFLGCGSYLPEEIVTNKDLEERVETNDEWIVQRTGICERRFANESEPTSVMATRAAQAALDHAGLTADDIDLVLVATTTPDLTFPCVAVHVQAALGMTKGFGFDIQAVCSGFVYGLGVADGMIKSGQARKVLLIGADKMSSLLDWEDRTTCVLFGDGAGAVVLGASEEDDGKGILATRLHSDGRHVDLLKTDGGVATTGNSGYLRMKGRDVFRHAVESLASVVDEVMQDENIKPDDIDWLVPHQANIRIIQGMADKLKLGTDNVVTTIDRHGNTSAASVPLALDEVVIDGRIKAGDLVLFEAMGGGFAWGAVLLRM